MSKRKCSKCFFGEQCQDAHPCDYYYPVRDTDLDGYTDGYIKKLLREDRAAFNEEWQQYIKEYGDD